MELIKVSVSDYQYNNFLEKPLIKDYNSIIYCNIEDNYK